MESSGQRRSDVHGRASTLEAGPVPRMDHVVAMGTTPPWLTVTIDIKEQADDAQLAVAATVRSNAQFVARHPLCILFAINSRLAGTYNKLPK
jgi:hypothetical protein